MSEARPARAPMALPERPNLEHLKNEARRRLKAMRDADPAAKLSTAQFRLARDYGFDSWRALKEEVERRNAPPPHADGLARFAGWYRHDPAVVTNAAAEFGADGGRLWLQGLDTPRIFLRQTGPARFGVDGSESEWIFEDGPTPAPAVVHAKPTGRLTLHRIDAATAAAMREAYLAAIAEQKRRREHVPVVPQALDRLVGRYRSAYGGDVEILRGDERLYVKLGDRPRLELSSEAPERWFLDVAPIQLRFDPGDAAAQGLWLASNGREVRMQRVGGAPDAARAARLAEQHRPRVLARIDPAVLPAYAGVYAMAGGLRVIVLVEGERLFAQISGQDCYELFPEAEDKFFWTITAAQIRFVRGPDGRVSHAVLYQHGVDVVLPRLEEESAP